MNLIVLVFIASVFIASMPLFFMDYNAQFFWEVRMICNAKRSAAHPIEKVSISLSALNPAGARLKAIMKVPIKYGSEWPFWGAMVWAYCCHDFLRTLTTLWKCSPTTPSAVELETSRWAANLSGPKASRSPIPEIDVLPAISCSRLFSTFFAAPNR